MGSGGKLHSFWCDGCQWYVPFSDWETCETNCQYCEAKADKARANAAEAALAAAQVELAQERAVAATRAEGEVYEEGGEPHVCPDREGDTTVPRTAEQERQAIIAWLRKQGGRAAWTLVGEIEKCAHLWGTNREE